jgi:hypothetical protein
MKKSYNDRMETLKNFNVDTSKYFNVMISKEAPKGTTFTITIGDDGEPKVNMEMVQQILNNIEDEGYVKSNKLFRRWVMAQTFRMLNHPRGWKAALDEKPYFYQWTMLENELHAMSKLEVEDKVTFEQRKCFFTKEVILDMLKDYKVRAGEYYKKNWGYYNHSYATTVYNNAIGIADITIQGISNSSSYGQYYHIIKEFNRESIKGRPDIRLPKETEKCKVWIEAFKGAGAYYTLENLMKYHLGSQFMVPAYNRPCVVDRIRGLVDLEAKKLEYKNEWWKLFGYMKEIIRLNGFDFNKAMKERYQ